MKNMIRRLLLSMALVSSLAVAARAQGLSFETENLEGMGVGQYIAYRPQMLRAVSKDSSHITIVRLDKDMVYLLNPRQKTYRDVSFAQLDARLKKELSRAQQLQQEQLKSLTPQQRQEIHEGPQGGGGNMDVTGKAIATGDSLTIDGHRCAKYLIAGNGRQQAELWVTGDVPETDTLRNDIRQLASRFSDVAARYGILDLAQNIDGFPIEVRQGDTIRRITNIHRATFPQQYFEVPAGYTHVRDRQGSAGSDTTQTDKD